jgi:helicase
MAFKGLFVGIDKYASRRIPQLRFAKRDAVALHALFADTLGPGAVLLRDDEATRAAIEEQFNRLTQCSEDDVVVLGFSGHGTTTHELVTYDADPQAFATSCIPLETLTEWFKRIPARRLVCFLDCCFSGGMGAKVLQADIGSRDLASVDPLLNQLSGDGRLILTASSATEPAYEHTKIGHGFLTHFLLEALQGVEEVQRSGKISVYQLLDYVTRRVSDGVAQYGKQQHPQLRGAIDGNLSWPQFQPGALYRVAFPERTRAEVTADLQSLAGYGFPPALIDAWASSIPSLNQLQLDAINEFNVLEGEHLVVSAPTSSGKTMVGELAALKGALKHNRAFFLLPLKSLVNDKYQHFSRTYGTFGLVTIRATGEIADDIPALMRGQYDICLMTYEKFAALALGSPHILEQVGTIVIDEVQMIADKSRGANLEFILTLLRMRRRQGIDPQLVALSAVIGDTNGLEGWLGARLLKREERPVPLEEGVLRGDGSFRYIDPSGDEKMLQPFIHRQGLKDSSQDWVIPLVQRLVSEGKQVIVFRETRGLARGAALYLARELGLPPAQATLDALPEGDLSNASDDLRKALTGGVAFHTSNLDREERLVIEEQFRAKDTTLRVIAATTTLAMGVNTPAESVIIVGLQHPQNQPYSVAEYKNMVGRAGRLGYSERGASYLLALSPHDEHYFWERYVTGSPENLHSRFLNGADPRSLILRVLAATQQLGAQGITSEEMADFLEGSFGAYQETQAAQNWQWSRQQLMEALAELEMHTMVEKDGSGRYQLTQLGRLAGEGGVEVETIVRLVDLFTSIDPSSINEQTLIAATQLTVELDQLNFPVNKKSTQKEPFVWPNELVRQGVTHTAVSALKRRVNDQHQGTLRAKKAVACLLWMSEWPLTEVERVLTQFGGTLDGAAGDIRAVSTRSVDLLPTVIRVAELLHSGLDLSGHLSRLLTRLEVGVPGSAVDLAAIAGSRLRRDDYQRLIKAGLCSINAIEVSSDEELLACLRDNQQKLDEIRRAVQVFRDREADPLLAMPTLPLYES